MCLLAFLLVRVPAAHAMCNDSDTVDSRVWLSNEGMLTQFKYRILEPPGGNRHCAGYCRSPAYRQIEGSCRIQVV
jgi:hypothetical protein